MSSSIPSFEISPKSAFTPFQSKKTTHAQKNLGSNGPITPTQSPAIPADLSGLLHSTVKVAGPPIFRKGVHFHPIDQEKEKKMEMIQEQWRREDIARADRKKINNPLHRPAIAPDHSSGSQKPFMHRRRDDAVKAAPPAQPSQFHRVQSAQAEQAALQAWAVQQAHAARAAQAAYYPPPPAAYYPPPPAAYNRAAGTTYYQDAQGVRFHAARPSQYQGR